jgi:hypothetical protein
LALEQQRLAFVCILAAVTVTQDGANSAQVFGSTLSWSVIISILVFIAAFVRTFADYWLSDEFMFP